MLKLVKGATKPKEAAPKAKYIEPILATTFEAGGDFTTVMDGLDRTLAKRGGPWTSLFKALIVLHIMIREGAEDVTLKYMSRHPRMLEVEEHSNAPGLGKYSRYLSVRAAQFKDTRVDDVRYKDRDGHSRLYGLPAHKSLLKGCESVTLQLDALVKCHFAELTSSDVMLMVFRLLVHDCLTLFQVMNEGVINLLEHFFELSKTDAEHALDIYRGFTRLTTKVITYLREAKNLEYKTKLHVPNIKHAPTSLVSSLEMYLNDPDFDANRRQYLAEKQAHEVKRSASKSKHSRSKSAAIGGGQPTAATAQSARAVSSSSQVPASPVVANNGGVGGVGAPGVPVTTTQPIDTNIFWPQNQEQNQLEALAQVQAARIQLQEGQAQLQMQQLQLQQQQQIQALAQTQAHLQFQHTGQAPMQPQPIQPQPTQPTAQYAQYAPAQPQNYQSFDFGQQTAPVQPQPTTPTVPVVAPQHTAFDQSYMGQPQPQAQQQQPQQQFDFDFRQQPQAQAQPQPQAQAPTQPQQFAQGSAQTLIGNWPELSALDFSSTTSQPQSFNSMQTIQTVQSVPSQPTTPPAPQYQSLQPQPTVQTADNYAHNPFKRTGSVLETQYTGKNPFARPPQTAQATMPQGMPQQMAQQLPQQQTGTNPFRLSLS